MQLSAHFSLAELTHTGTGLPNNPNPIEIGRLFLLARFMEKVRAICGNRAITVNSAFRSEAVNNAVGGVSNSAHRLGFACDFTVDALTPYQVCQLLDSAGKVGRLVFDQLILEQMPTPTWTHISRDPKARGQRLTKLADGSYTGGLIQP